MSVITKGRIFANGEQLTAEKLNALVDDASFNSSTAVDNSTTRVSTSGAITVRPQGITGTELAPGAVITNKIANGAVTEDKIDTGAVTNAKIDDGAVTEAKIAASERWQNAYPVGSIYMNASNSSNPSTLLGFGTWAAFGAGRVPVGINPSDGNFNTAGETGGAKTHTLSQAEMNHNHIWATTGGTGADISIALTTNGTRNDTFDDSGDSRALTSDGALSGTNYTDNNRALSSTSVTAHNNLQPYIVVYMWKRTA